MKLRTTTHMLLPLMGVAGIVYGVVFAGGQDRQASDIKPVAPKALPPSSSFAQAISGSGLIEANTRNIAVGSHLSGIISALYVGEGDTVEKGAPLFMLDDRTARASVTTAESNLAVAQAQLAEARVSLADQRDQLARVRGLKEGVVVSADRVSRLRFAVQAADTRLNVASAAVEEAQARLKEAMVTLEKTTVTAPITGRILKLNTRVGEFVQAGETGNPRVVIGNDTPLHVRVSLDENDLWRFNQNAKANGALRSNRDVNFPLSFVRLEPYVVPKTSLTGVTSERVDTRVLEVVYRIDATDAPVYIGQQVDVFIEETAKTEMPKGAALPVVAAPPAPTETQPAPMHADADEPSLPADPAPLADPAVPPPPMPTEAVLPPPPAPTAE